MLVPRGVQDLDRRPPAERRSARQHLEQDRAGREQIAAGIDEAAHGLFRRHVAGRAQHQTGARDAGDGVERFLQLGSRQAEVQQLHAVRGQEHIRGLEIAMNDPARVQRRKGRQDTQADGHGLRGAERPAPEKIGEHLALEQLHGDEQLPVVLADLVDLADVGMIDARRGAGFPPESRARGLVPAKRGHRLDGDRSFQPRVAGRIDDAHPALAELVHDGVGPDAGWLRRQRDVARRARRPRRRRGAGQPAIESAQSSARSLIHQYADPGKRRSYPQTGDPGPGASGLIRPAAPPSGPLERRGAPAGSTR